MRVTVAVGAAVPMLMVGIIAISQSAQEAESSINSTAANESYAAAEGVFGGVAMAASDAVVLFGIAAIVLVGLGLLVTAGRSGR